MVNTYSSEIREKEANELRKEGFWFGCFTGILIGICFTLLVLSIIGGG